MRKNNPNTEFSAFSRIDPFVLNLTFLAPSPFIVLEKIRKIWFPDVFRGYRNLRKSLYSARIWEILNKKTRYLVTSIELPN